MAKILHPGQADIFSGDFEPDHTPSKRTGFDDLLGAYVYGPRPRLCERAVRIAGANLKDPYLFACGDCGPCLSFASGFDPETYTIKQLWVFLGLADIGAGNTARLASAASLYATADVRSKSFVESLNRPPLERLGPDGFLRGDIRGSTIIWKRTRAHGFALAAIRQFYPEPAHSDDEPDLFTGRGI